MTAEKKPRSLKHYTSIESLFKILDSEYLLLGDPEKWDDKNDLAALRAFCRLKGEETKTRALCFLDGEESVHHRNTFAKNGCSISIGRDYILNQVIGKTCFLHGPIEYKRNITADELRKLAKDEADKIPFLKRNQYECEKEYRIIWFGTSETPPKIKLEGKAIKNIILSPGIPDIIREKLKDYLKMKYVKVKEAKMSRIEESGQWISKFDQLGKKKSGLM